MSLAEADEQAFGQVEAFGPFGEANPKPVLYSKNLLIVDMQRLGGDGQHLKMRLQQADSPLRSAIGFSVPIEWSGLRVGDRVDLVYYLDINDWNGRRETQLKIVDLKKV
jgi:single-stranded-DNA-specific exonuclease